MTGLLLVSGKPQGRWHPEFPTVRGTLMPAPPIHARRVSAKDWLESRRDLFEFDAQIGDAASGALPPLFIEGGERGELERASVEILTRYQGALDRRNAASDDGRFQRVLEAFRACHDFSKPLVRADWCHALDTWQWLLRIAPDATLELQLAALLHDIERLDSEPDQRVEQHAADYQAFKDAHARAGAGRALELLRSAGIETSTAARVAALVESHEHTHHDCQRLQMNDADALSFFSLNSHGFLAYYGLEHTRRKVAWTLARLSPEARSRLGAVRLSPAISGLLSSLREDSHEERA